MNTIIQNKIEAILNEKIVNEFSVSGGCISDAKIINTETGKHFFLKSNNNNPSKMFLNEANGLKELEKSNTIRVPKVISAADDYILLEVISSSSKSKHFFEDFGRNFAEIHKHTNEQYGFYENNYIGSLPQINIPENMELYDWPSFYFNKRLKFQINLAENNGYLTDELSSAFSKLENKIESILSNNNEKPALLHGDLWSGNFIIDENGSACLIDPAVYYGNREADLAMTKLFGGFDNIFYSAYNEYFPLPEGCNYRENIYKLYHVLNHLNLFGQSYYHQALNLIRYYL